MIDAATAPVLTALVVTYNHAPFIEEAIATVFAQETDFPFEVIVSEDCSTDDTRQIVQRLARNHPGRIQLMLSDRNRNDNTVLRRGLEAARGRYVALLDGDDFWTSPTKLQRQVEFLDSHPDATLCFHNAIVAYEDEDVEAHPFLEERPRHPLSAVKPGATSGLNEIVRTDFIPTCSVMLHKDVVLPLPGWYDAFPYGDWALCLFCAERGSLCYLDEVMATYRAHAGGYWSSAQSRYSRLSDVEELVEAYEVVNRYLDHRFERQIAKEVSRVYEMGSVNLYRAGQNSAARVSAWRAFRRRPLSALKRWRAAAVFVLAATRSAIGASAETPARRAS